MEQPKEKEQKKKQWNARKILLWLPVYLTLLFLPMVVFYKEYASRYAGEAFYISSEINFDFTLYYKQIVFFVITGLTAILLCGQIYKNRAGLFEKNKLRKQWYILIPLMAYLLFAFLSSVCSEHKYAAFTGADTQFESFFILAGYLLLAVYLLFLLEEERDVRCASAALFLGMLEMAILGILQYSGNNLYQFSWYQKLVVPKEYREVISAMDLTDKTVTLNAFNSNYAGVLLAMLAAVCIGILFTERNIVRITAEAVLLFALVICLVGTNSKAGMLVFGVTVVFALLYLARRLLKYWHLIIPVLTAVVLAGMLFLQYRDIPLFEQLKSALTVEKQEKNPIERMVTTENGVEITYRGTFFKIRVTVREETFDVLVIDENGKRIPMSLSDTGNVYTLEEGVLQGITIEPKLMENATPVFVLTIEGREWAFLPKLNWNQCYYYLNDYNHWETLSETRRFGFYGYENFASGRGLIWSQTLPLLFDNVVLGEGANCFAYAYPNNNYKDIFYNSYSGSISTVTRPHSMYLKIGVETGLASLLILLVFWGWYLFDSYRLYRKVRLETWTQRMGFSCFLGTFAYLACGISNDSMITTAPTFWCIFGMGLAINRMIKRKIR